MKKTGLKLFLILIAGLIVSCGKAEPLSIVMDSGKGGSSTISGTIMLPTEIKAGATAGIAISKRGGEGTPWSKMKGAMQTTGSNEVVYQITNVPDGEYLIQFQVITENKDKYEGYYGGTADSPMLDEMSAKKVIVSGSSQADINFGIGK